MQHEIVRQDAVVVEFELDEQTLVTEAAVVLEH